MVGAEICALSTTAERRCFLLPGFVPEPDLERLSFQIQWESVVLHEYQDLVS
jgi:hypothetical protein